MQHRIRNGALAFAGALLLLTTGAQSQDRERPPHDRGHRGPPPGALEACEEMSEGDLCAVDTPDGTHEGTCRVVPEGDLACVPNGMRPPPR